MTSTLPQRVALACALVALCLAATRLPAPAGPALARALARVLAGDLPGLAARPRFAPPVSGARVSSGFGWRVRDGRPEFHAGLDLEAGEGTPVRALAPGVVRRVGDDPRGYGRYVVIAHGGGWETLYAHDAEVEVAAGEPVRRGQVIARVGRTGNATSPHLHLEVRLRGRPLDPAPLLGLAGPR